jgi:hypothetical protein
MRCHVLCRDDIISWVWGERTDERRQVIVPGTLQIVMSWSMARGGASGGGGVSRLELGLPGGG